MKKGKTIWILLATLALIIAAIFVVKGIEEKKEELSQVDEIISTLDPEKITEIDWTTSSGSLSFHYADGTWTCDEDNLMPVSSDAMDKVLTHLESVHACFIIENVEDYSQYGLEDPTGTIHYTTEEGETTLKLGTYNTLDEIRYVSTGNGNVYLVEDDLTEIYDLDKETYLQIEKHPTIGTVTGITISGDTNLELYYDEENTSSYLNDIVWWLNQTDSENELDQGLPVKTSSATAMATVVTSYLETNPVTYTASSADLSEYGLDNPKYTVTVEGTTEVTQEDGTTETEEVSYTFDFGLVDDYYPYVRVQGSEFIFMVSTTTSTKLQGYSVDSLIYNNMITVQDWTKAEKVTFTLEDQEYSFDFNWQKPLDEDGNETDGDLVCNEREGEISLEKIMDGVDALTLSSYEHPEISGMLEFEMTLNLENDVTDSFTLQFYRYDTESCIAVVNGNAVGYITRDLMVDLREACTVSVIQSEE